MKVFRLEEANALLPVLRPLVQKLLDKRRDLAIKLLEAETAQLKETEATGGLTAATRRRQAEKLQQDVLECVDSIGAHGCVVKDIGLGLLDFPALRAGQLVNLCWKFDEPTIGFWHGLDEGFAARKSIARRRK